MFASVAFLVVVSLLFLIFSQTNRKKNFPPGPRPLPFIGNLLELNLENPLADLERVMYRRELAIWHIYNMLKKMLINVDIYISMTRCNESFMIIPSEPMSV